MSIERWDQDGFPDHEGMFILYSDHLAAVADAKQGHLRDAEQYGYEQGRADAAREIETSVMSLPTDRAGVRVRLSGVLAVIDALRGRS